jgi:DNA-binding HxlR family transcriptional regulator
LKRSRQKSQSSWEHVKEFCDTLTDDEDALTREMVACITDKWSLWTMSVIAEFGSPMRFSRILENVAGISQKSLTKTLRGLERDGLITARSSPKCLRGSNMRLHRWAPRCSTMSYRFGCGLQRAYAGFKRPVQLLTVAACNQRKSLAFARVVLAWLRIRNMKPNGSIV